MTRIRAAVVGAGLIARKKHIPAFRRLGGKLDLVAVCDLDRDAAAEVADRHGIDGVYDDPSEMLAREQPMLVDVCTPPPSHREVATQALRAGAHVLVEKPMAMTVEECEEIIEAAAAADLTVCVAHTDLFYPPFVKARRRVEAGEIGAFRGMRIFLSTPRDYMTARPDHWAHDLPGGVIGESGPHVVYMALAFINPVRDVVVRGTKLLDEYPWSEYEDYRLILRGDGGVCSATLSYATDQWMARVEILGEEGSLLLDLESMWIASSRRRELTPARVAGSTLKETGAMLWSTLTSGLRIAARRWTSTHASLLDRYADSILSGDEPPVPPAQGREAVRVMNSIASELEGEAHETRTSVESTGPR